MHAGLSLALWLPVAPPVESEEGHFMTGHLLQYSCIQAHEQHVCGDAGVQQQKNIHHNKSVRNLSSAPPILTTATTATLSQWHSTHWPHHCLPHSTIANIIGRSYFCAMTQSCDGPSHFHWNHCDPQDAAQPQTPDVSASSECDTINRFGIKETSFQTSMYLSHHIKSEWVDIFSLIQ